MSSGRPPWVCNEVYVPQAGLPGCTTVYMSLRPASLGGKPLLLGYSPIPAQSGLFLPFLLNVGYSFLLSPGCGLFLPVIPRVWVILSPVIILGVGYSLTGGYSQGVKPPSYADKPATESTAAQRRTITPCYTSGYLYHPFHCWASRAGPGPSSPLNVLKLVIPARTNIPSLIFSDVEKRGAGRRE